MEEDEIPKDMPFERLDKSRPAAFEPLEQVRPAEAHQPLSGTGELLYLLRFCFSRRFVRRCLDVVAETVARQAEGVDCVHYFIGVQAGVLIARVVLIEFELLCFGHAVGEIKPLASIERQILATVRRVGLCVVVLDEGSRAAYKVQPHEIAPVVGIFALLKCCQRPDGALVPPNEFRLA